MMRHVKVKQGASKTSCRSTFSLKPGAKIVIECILQPDGWTGFWWACVTFRGVPPFAAHHFGASQLMVAHLIAIAKNLSYSKRNRR